MTRCECRHKFQSVSMCALQARMVTHHGELIGITSTLEVRLPKLVRELRIDTNVHIYVYIYIYMYIYRYMDVDDYMVRCRYDTVSDAPDV